MKKLLSQLSVTVLFLTFLSCTSNEEPASTTPTKEAVPTADFSFTGNQTPAPAPIVFENKSTNATDYLWDFGDGSSSSSLEKNPTHTYAAAGTYTVELIATGKGGSNIKTKTIQITAPAKPTTLTITGVTITEMSFIDANSEPWDSTSGPDLEFTIYDIATYKDYISSSTFNNITASQLPVTWTLPTPKTITDLTKDWGVSVGDVDGQYVDGIAQVYFTPADYTTGPNAYPKKITLKYTDPNEYNPQPITTFVLDVNWQ